MRGMRNERKGLTAVVAGFKTPVQGYLKKLEHDTNYVLPFIILLPLLFGLGNTSDIIY